MAGKARLPVAKTYKIYIDGKFPRTESGRYLPLYDGRGDLLANVCRSSRKDFRNAVVAARKAQPGWASASAYLRGQILYRVAEMLEGRAAQFADELARLGCTPKQATREVEASIDRLIYFAGWADKYQQVFSAVNPVASSHFVFSVLEPAGVVAIVAPGDTGLIGLIATVAPAIVGGNACIVLASESRPTPAISFAEVLHASDVPAGVVNVLTGLNDELVPQFASHMDVNSVVHDLGSRRVAAAIQEQAAENLKRVVARPRRDWLKPAGEDPWLIRDTQEVKTTWHPIGT